MTLEELVAEFRSRSQDKEAPYLWSDSEIERWLSDAQRQACMRGRLIREVVRDEVCSIALVPGQAVYPLHPSVYEITYICIAPTVGPTRPLDLVSREWLDRTHPRWREPGRDCRWVIQDDTSIQVAAPFKPGDVLRLECYRLPLESLDDSDEPEIHEAHHEHLVDWALHRAFSVPDAEGFDPTRAALSEAAFTRYFGPLPDSDLRRMTREDVPHHNAVILP